MFCSNCGKQIPDNTKFCNYCGAQQQIVANVNSAPKTTVNQPKASDVPTQVSKDAPKKKKNIIISLVGMLCAFLIGKFVIAPVIVPSYVSDSDKNNNISSQGNQTQQSIGNDGESSVEPSNAAYDAILENAYIVHFQSFFNMDMESFAIKLENGAICCADYGYKDDVVKQWVETMYIPVSEYTDTEKMELENTMKAEFATVDELNCCTVTYRMGTNYFTITCTYSDVDQAANRAELYKVGVLQTNSQISMSKTETNLLSQGFVKK